ncbi:MAG: hypothetical protein HY654_09795 [Acidobacteria bacterium]|nr:hypothetical protein [Acidobacteriota bacterium]
MKRLSRPAVVLLLILWLPSCGANQDPAPQSDPGSKPAPLSIGERYQKANLEVSQLLIEADRRRVDVREFRSRHTGITLASVKNFESATYEMEKLAAELKQALGK